MFIITLLLTLAVGVTIIESIVLLCYVKKYRNLLDRAKQRDDKNSEAQLFAILALMGNKTL